jgi:hypothetical protein
MVKRLKQFMWLLSAILMLGANAHAADSRPSLSKRQVADAMISAGIPVKAAQVEFLSQLSASEDVSLQVVTIRTSTEGTATVKLRCHDNRECLPFYVLVHDVRSAGVSDVHHRRVQIATGQARTDKVSSPRLVRGGDHATLLLETSDFRISLPVICLESGMRGQRIRVTSRDGRRFYKGEVVEVGILRGSL